MTGQHPRYPGSPPFADTELDRLLFYGRNDEATDVADAVLSYDLLVVYGVSGTGKSSLLRAGVFARLRDEDLWPVVVRLNDPSADPVGLIAEHLVEQAAAEGVELQPAAPAGADLWELLAGLEVWRGDVLQTPVLVFDQFEELFTLEWDPDVRAGFVEQFGWIARGHRPIVEETAPPRPRVKLVLLIREDSLGELEALAGDVPRIMRHRFRLLPLSVEQAEAAIRGPAAVDDQRLKSPPFSYADDAVHLMLEHLRVRHERGRQVRTDSVDPSQLQIICQHVEDAIVGRRPDAVVTAADLGGPEGLVHILQDFYGNQIAALPAPQAAAARALCETGLVNTAGRRLSLEIGEIEANYGVPPPLLARLVEQRLLRAEARTGSVYYELAHDSLVAPILAYREAREAEERQRRRRRRLGVAAAGVAALMVLVGWFVVRNVGRDASLVQGRLTAADNSPIAGATVEFHTETPDGTEQGEESRAQTDGSGEFKTRLPDGVYRVRFAAPGYASRWWMDGASYDEATAIRIPAPDGAVDPLEVTLLTTGFIDYVVAADGPVTVEVRDGNGEQVDGSDEASGRLTVPAGEYDVAFTSPGFEPEEIPTSVGAGLVAELSVVLAPITEQPVLVELTRTYEGEVDVPPGARLAVGYELTNLGSEDVRLAGVEEGGTPVDGIEAGQVIPAMGRLEVTGTIIAPSEAGCVAPVATASLARRGDARRVSTAGGRYCVVLPVTGQVFLDDDEDGERDANESVVAEAVVSLLAGEDLAPTATVTTGADGRFTLRARPGDYVLAVDPVQDTVADVRTREVTVAGSRAPDPVAIGLRPLLFTVAGTVFWDRDLDGAFDDGEQVRGIAVALCAVEACAADPPTMRTGADGRFSFEVSDGGYTLIVGGDEAASLLGAARQLRGTKRIAVAGADLTGVLVRVTRAADLLTAATTTTTAGG